MSKFCPIFVQVLPRFCPGYVQVLSRFCPSLSKFCPGYIQVLSKFCPSVVQVLSKCCSCLLMINRIQNIVMVINRRQQENPFIVLALFPSKLFRTQCNDLQFQLGFVQFCPVLTG